ncbi:hypothetical protein KIH75_06350 [Bifidobacterium sp. 64T4]|uniref:PfkB family carbohydrate kinase n=1 Tax=Bifidobacterium pongonis TaxID=2834432 RepID=UPI001C588E43|nr:PfkB family carbohydrate kinase [Bifidobacterium pongonis]MBW3094958.1 hypothetical protein [Bifidobacterium pongonis]
MVGQVISLGQIIVDLTMNVAAVPHAGEDVFADGVQTRVGASFNTLYAVRRMGVAAAHAGIIGTGPWASQIMRALELHGIRHIGKRDGSRDSGFCMALTDANAERTFISTRGAEAYGEADAFDAVDPSARDVVHISGYTLVHRTSEALLAFMRRTAEHRGFAAVFDASPVIAQADDRMFRAMLDYRPIWSCNEREAVLIAQRLLRLRHDDDAYAHDAGDACEASDRGIAERLAATADMRDAEVDASLVAWLRDRLQATVIVRTGKDGAWLAVPAHEPRHIAGFPVQAVDTNGAGDCHAGVLCARLCEGARLEDAVRYANAAAALAVTKRGPATCPGRDEVERLLA